MNALEELENRFKELAGRPKSTEEVEEAFKIAETLEFLRSGETTELLSELEQVGVNVNSVWELVNSTAPYPTAITILIKHLSRNYHLKNKEGIIRALGVKDATGEASAALISEYDNIPKEEGNLRWVIGNSIFAAITKNDTDNIIKIVQDKSNGTSRGMFVAALGKIKSEKVENCLIQLLEDDEVTPQALDALGRLKSQMAKDKISLLLHHPKPLIRTEAQKALKKIK